MRCAILNTWYSLRCSRVLAGRWFGMSSLPHDFDMREGGEGLLSLPALHVGGSYKPFTVDTMFLGSFTILRG